MSEPPYNVAPLVAASAMQTACQGPMEAGGMGPLSKDDQKKVKTELQALKEMTGWPEPSRAHMDDPGTQWRFGKAPDYSLANLEYFKYKTKHHAPGSLEQIVENLVKTWEFERSHKTNPDQHMVANHEGFYLSANNGKKYGHLEACEVGNYNALLETASKDLWNVEKITNRNSHEIFHETFPAFAWEILEVYTGPPDVHFTWRHFGRFTGVYKGHKGTGEMVDVRGHGVATVNGKLQLLDTKIYYNQNAFLEVLEGKRPASDLVDPAGVKCAINDKKNWVPKGSAKLSIYTRIGGAAAIGLAVDLFYDKVLKDDRINEMFKNTTMTKLKDHQRKFLTVALGGPNEYSGKDMRSAHQFVNGGRHPTEAHFMAVAENLIGTLKELSVHQSLIDEVVAVALTVKDDVCGVKK